MKVVLIEDVKSLGKKGDVVEVSEGYARNFLLAKKHAVEATAANLNTLKLQKANADKIAAELLAQARELSSGIDGKEVKIGIKGGENGKAFGSVSNKEIAQAIKDQLGIDVDKKKIVLADAIKEFGKKEIPVKLHKDVTANVTVNIVEQ